MDNFDIAQAFDKKHNVFSRLNDAFERSGGCGHDLGVVGALAVIQAWEKIRTEDAVRDLRPLDLTEYD